MKSSFQLRMILAFFLIGCGREEPMRNTTTNPPGVITLQPITVIDLSANIPEPSGIFFNAKNNSLMVVSDARPEIFEIDFSGNVLKTILTSGSDLEGITLNKTCDTIYVVEETRQLVTSYLTNGTKISSFPVNVATNPKNALEGITLDKNRNLFVLNEKTPRLIIEYNKTTEVSRKEITNATDISDICYDETSDCFWIVSDESQKVIKTARDGSVLSEWLIPFTKGEGITFVNDKMYIVNDADAKMYIFQKP
jgi:uncharacterized protein YjiK